MAAIKVLGIIFTFYMFFVLESFGQNFYPARYGKREESENRRIGRSGANDALNNRKMGFFVSGGRFGKRGCTSENCLEGSKEIISSGYQTRQDRSERIRVPARKNQFMVGSRFGKRMDLQNETEDSGVLISGESLRCILTGFNDLSKCLKRTEKIDEDDPPEANSYSEFFQ